MSRSGMKRAQGEWPYDQVAVVDQVGIEYSVVNAATKDFAIQAYSYHATLGLNHMPESRHSHPAAFVLQLLVNVREQTARGGDNCHCYQEAPQQRGRHLFCVNVAALNHNQKPQAYSQQRKNNSNP